MFEARHKRTHTDKEVQPPEDHLRDTPSSYTSDKHWSLLVWLSRRKALPTNPVQLYSEYDQLGWWLKTENCCNRQQAAGLQQCSPTSTHQSQSRGAPCSFSHSRSVAVLAIICVEDFQASMTFIKDTNIVLAIHINLDAVLISFSTALVQTILRGSCWHVLFFSSWVGALE